MGLVKSDAQRKANQLQRKSAIAAADQEDHKRAQASDMVGQDAGLCGDKPLPGSGAKEGTR